MFQLSNDTPFAAERSVQLDQKGVQHWVVIVKGSYRFDGPAPKLVADQEPVCLAPKYLGDPGQSSLLRESEMTFGHPGTDVLLNAVAHAPAGHQLRQMDVRVSVGQLTKTVRVFGDRQWVGTGVDVVPSWPIPFEKMPISYERAYGGALADGSAFEERNPIGRGFGLTRQQLVDQPLPNIEDPTEPIRSIGDRPTPAGLSAISSSWRPRRQLAGTFDAAWEKTKLPLLPDDFAPAFFVAAPSGLHSPTPLQGGERVRLEGLSPAGRIEFSVPREVISITTTIGRAKTRHSVQLDRVIIEPETRLVVLIWRASLRLGPRFRDVIESYVSHKPRIYR